MKNETRLMQYLTLFFILCAIAYGVATGFFRPDGVEWAGETALVLLCGLTLISGGYFWFISRRLEPRPEDIDGEIADAAGPVGFFSPGSIWPVVIAFFIAITAISIALGNFWLTVPAGIGVVFAASSLVFEYHKGPEKH